MNPKIEVPKALLSIEELAQQLLHFWNPCGAASRKTNLELVRNLP